MLKMLYTIKCSEERYGFGIRLISLPSTYPEPYFTGFPEAGRYKCT
jgi:hypothetical protein